MPSANLSDSRVGAPSPSQVGQYVKLLLWRAPHKRDKYLIALRATAEYYGWMEAFPEYTLPPLFEEGGRTYVQFPRRNAPYHMQAGMRLRICRSESTAGTPKGLTNQFKVSRNCRLLDIAEVAHFSKGDWHWMTGPYGERIRRDHWARIHEAQIPGRRGVALSV